MTIAHTRTHTLAGDLSVAYREGSSDELVMAEFQKDMYGVGKIRAGQRWLDIGANIGLFSMHAAAAGAIVEAFEPDAANYELLVRNVADQPNVRTYPLAVTPEGARVRLQQDEPDAYWQIKAVPDPLGSPSLELRRLITPDCRIKMDVEGAEQRLILGTPVRTWSKVAHLVLEYHLDRLTLAQFAQVKQHLTSAGFAVSHPKLDAGTLERYQKLQEPFIVTARRP
jgi:FkbM family methyltransferase